MLTNTRLHKVSLNHAKRKHKMYLVNLCFFHRNSYVVFAWKNSCCSESRSIDKFAPENTHLHNQNHFDLTSSISLIAWQKWPGRLVRTTTKEEFFLSMSTKYEQHAKGKNELPRKRKWDTLTERLTLGTHGRLTLNCEFLNKCFGLINTHFTHINILVFVGNIEISEPFLLTLNLLLGVSTREFKICRKLMKQLGSR